jgi:hypothetical protein
MQFDIHWKIVPYLVFQALIGEFPYSIFPQIHWLARHQAAKLSK